MVYACYIPASGTMYRIREAGLKEACVSPQHVELNWNQQGIQGVAGAQGPQGLQGIQGPQGLQGIAGARGEMGPQGPQGAKGDTGSQGVQGIQGAPGLSGWQRISIVAEGETLDLPCPVGKKVLGGGYTPPSNAEVQVQASYPVSESTWRVVVKNTGNSRVNFTGYAVCANVAS